MLVILMTNNEHQRELGYDEFEVVPHITCVYINLIYNQL